jgi:hypothetical protein
MLLLRARERGNIEPGDLPALLFEVLTGVQDGMVLNFRSDDVSAPGFLGFSDSPDCEVVRFSASADEDDLGRFGVNQA